MFSTATSPAQTQTTITQPTPGRGRRASLRKPAVVASLGLLAMAVLAPIATMMLIPAQEIVVAALLMAVVAVLDVVVAVALIPVFARGGRRLSLAAAALRIGYAAALAVATGTLFAADAEAFDSIWQTALGLFGLHLVALAIAGWRSPIVPRWIAAFVAIAGVGYLVDALLSIAQTTLGFELSTVTFIGEVALLVWLLGWAGRS